MLAIVALPLAAQTGAKSGEWPTYGGDLGNTRYAPLNRSTPSISTSSQIAWRFKTDNLGPRPEYNLEVDAADGQRRDVLHRRHAPRGGRAGCRDRRTAVGAQRE